MELIPMIRIDYIELFVNRFDAFGDKFKRKSYGRIIYWNLSWLTLIEGIDPLNYLLCEIHVNDVYAR